MKESILFFLIILLLGQYSFGNTDSVDIVNFIEKKDQCDHLRGEISGEPEIDNARNLNAELDNYCKGTDQELVKLKSKYKNNKSVLDKLNEYEEIECINNCSDVVETKNPKPKFSNYSIANIDKNNIGKFPANFAGHYYVLTKGCGGGAVCGEIIDVKNSQSVAVFPNAYLIEDDDGNNYFTTNYQLASSLIIISGIAADTEVDSSNQILSPAYRERYYNFIDGKLVLLMLDEYIK